ncbi:putative WRKY transcription factor 70 [Senna tora]|uniref:Putative WRKY transcription factor 70 n=1 Tax=Senna tora TaxID=362788 RepID=A0A834WKF4_9FABA|nr:putative WRKY transcription factor 70 [Senna tora]
MDEKAAVSEAKKAIIIQELVNGREFANQLLQLVRHNNCNVKFEDNNEGSFWVLRPFAEDLVKKILKSFTNTLLLFNTCDSHHHHIPITNSSSSNRRGCYKRKRNIETWEKDSPILVEDGHEWRKYGQKVTRNTKYLRNYYRCSHKYDEGCEAMKQEHQVPTVDDHILLELQQLAVPQYHEHVTTTTTTDHVLSSSLDDLFSSPEVESFEVDDDLILPCFDFDDFVHFGL